MTAEQYLANVCRRLHEEYVEAIKRERANDGKAYFWGFKEGIELAMNIAVAHNRQFETAAKAHAAAVAEIVDKLKDKA